MASRCLWVVYRETSHTSAVLDLAWSPESMPLGCWSVGLVLCLLAGLVLGPARTCCRGSVRKPFIKQSMPPLNQPASCPLGVPLHQLTPTHGPASVCGAWCGHASWRGGFFP